jgi:hypothetical protein
MLKQVLAIAVVGALAAGSVAAHEPDRGYRTPYYGAAYHDYPVQYAPQRWYAPSYCPPARPWKKHGAHHGHGHGKWQGNYYGYDRYDRYDRDDHGGRGGRDDWDRRGH